MNEKLTAYALNELPPDERAELEAQMKDDPKLREEAEAVKAFCAMLENEVHASAEDTLDPEQRSKLVQTFQSTETKVIRPPFWRRAVFFNGLGLSAAACVALMFAWREVKEASHQAKDAQQSEFAYSGTPDAPGPVKHPSEEVTVTKAAPKPQAATPKRLTSTPSAAEVPKVSPVPFTPPLVGSGPLAPTDSMKLKDDQKRLWYGHSETKKDSGTLTAGGTLTADSGGVVKSGSGTLTLTGANTYSPGQAAPASSPTLSANASAPVEYKGVPMDAANSVREAKKAQTANPAINVNGNPPAVALDSLGSVSPSERTKAIPQARPAAGPLVAQNNFTGAAGGTLTPPPPDPFSAPARDQMRTKMLNQVNQGWKDQTPVSFDAPSKTPAEAARTKAPLVASATTAAAAAGAAPVPPVAEPTPDKTLVASADAAKKEVTAKDRDALAKEAEELKKQIEEMSTRSYQLSVHEAQRRILEEKLLQDRLATERLQRERRQQQYFAEQQRSRYGYSTATYRPIVENQFSFVSQEPLSTFSTDVDTASYANARRFLNAGMRPPPDAIRLEELINYFPYAYPAPEDDKPLAVKVDIGEAPWQPLHRLVRIAIKAREVKNAERPAANFTFLLDVSGSMSPEERLPLVKKALRLLVEQLREDDRVSIVTYAGESGLTLESTPGNEKEKILEAINALNAGGSTNGASGIRMAYEQAVSHYKKNGINRVILCTDGDFNVGTSNVEELKVLITEKAKTGVYLSVLGVGTDNLHDFTMQTLADCGNGNYHYLDSMSEARKVLVEQMTGNMITVAKDMKIQVEFNPAQVAAYRLIGYEKRMLEKEDFNNDKKDAGDIGAGHTITAFYEIVPADLKYPDGKPLVDDLKYDKPAAAPEAPAKAEVPAASRETMTVKLRYKEPNQDKSKLMTLPVIDAQKKLSENDRDFQFATSVAGFGMLLRGSPYGNELTWDTVRQLALSGKGEDEQGWRGEFIQLIEKARGICER